jgi:hypothetical protein
MLNSSNEQMKILIKPQVRKANSSGKDYDRRDSNYDSENDTYICPEGYLLTFRFMTAEAFNIGDIDAMIVKIVVKGIYALSLKGGVKLQVQYSNTCILST